MAENAWFESCLKEDRLYEQVEEGIYSFIPSSERKHAYDSKVQFYDRVVGSFLWNKLIWKNDPSAYDAFCSQTLHNTEGIVLDAGCGSLVFTENAYAEIGKRNLILLDRSLGMLLKAKKRLENRLGVIPENIIFIQADVFDLPFKENSFSVVNAFGMIHVFSNTEKFLKSLQYVKIEDGALNMLSLVSNNLLSRAVMFFLKKKGELSHIFSSDELEAHLALNHHSCHIDTVGNICYLRCQ